MESKNGGGKAHRARVSVFLFLFLCAGGGVLVEGLKKDRTSQLQSSVTLAIAREWVPGDVSVGNIYRGGNRYRVMLAF